MHAFRRRAGFTLMELMIVLAIVAILMAIAVPAYTSQMQRSRRSDAISSLQDLQLQEERFRADNPTYASTPAQLGNPLPTSPFYTFTIPVATATTYTLRATPRGGQVRDCNGAALEIRSVAGATTKVPAACW
jgi:type IV pilus assembly protein PilE